MSESARDLFSARAVPLRPLEFTRWSPEESVARARLFYDELSRRRTTRHFSSEPVPRELIELAIRTAGTAPSGAHQQPWMFVAVYYTQESCGIAAGLFVAAIHHMGLVTLTHTPNPMRFLAELLERPANEKAMLVLPVGYPASDAEVPDIARKQLAEISVWR